MKVAFLLLFLLGGSMCKYEWLEGPLLHKCWGCLRQPDMVFWIRSSDLWNLTDAGQCYSRRQVARAVARENFTIYGSYGCGQMSCLDPHVLEENYPISSLLCTEGEYILVYIYFFFLLLFSFNRLYSEE
jgi:hypothetical protein